MKTLFSTITILILGISCLGNDINPDRLKVDAEGNYLPFPGITIVSNIADKDVAFFEALQERLTQLPEFNNYFSLLPLRSYHVTLLNLHTKLPDLNENWHDFIEQNMPEFKQMKTHLDDVKIKPNIKLLSIKGFTGLNIEVKLENDDHEQTTLLAKKFKREKKMPKFFHIGLGYLREKISKIKHDYFIQEANKIFNILLEEREYSGKTLTLKQANLCHFPDMTIFIPWDAENIPES